ncbi:MAG: hypothetical protein HC850_03695 [Rhodomicrobium sp.]|nr:hypothetical protein [Rhodomicrobium sp.]
MAATLLAILGVLAATAAQKADISSLTPQRLAVTARPFAFDPASTDRRNFGRLEWRGGVILAAPSEHFGGYSALSIPPDGKEMLALSDAGSWLSARLATKDGQLVGLEDARIGPIPQKDGQVLQRKRDRDAEALVALSPGKDLDGRYLIGFEGRHRIDEYVFRKGAFKGPAGGVKLPRQLRGMGRNEGLEGVTQLRGGQNNGAIVAFAERKLAPDGNHTGVLLKKGIAYPLFLKRTGEFDITELASLKDGSLLVLERSFIRASLKLDIRLRLVDAGEIEPDAILDGETLLEADSRFKIDNFEAMAVTETEDGETLITLLSDDNFNFFQSTLLARFALKSRKVAQ